MTKFSGNKMAEIVLYHKFKMANFDTYPQSTVAIQADRNNTILTKHYCFQIMYLHASFPHISN